MSRHCRHCAERCRVPGHRAMVRQSRERRSTCSLQFFFFRDGVAGPDQNSGQHPHEGDAWHCHEMKIMIWPAVVLSRSVHWQGAVSHSSTWLCTVSSRPLSSDITPMKECMTRPHRGETVAKKRRNGKEKEKVKLIGKRANDWEVAKEKKRRRG